MLIRILIGISLFLLSSCSNISNESDLELKRGLFYNASNGKPFSGKAYKLYNNGSKMREGTEKAQKGPTDLSGFKINRLIIRKK